MPRGASPDRSIDKPVSFIVKIKRSIRADSKGHNPGVSFEANVADESRREALLYGVNIANRRPDLSVRVSTFLSGSAVKGI